jgi:hypothetical protein
MLTAGYTLLYIGLCYRAYYLIFDFSLDYTIKFTPYPQLVPWDIESEFDKTWQSTGEVLDWILAANAKGLVLSKWAPWLRKHWDHTSGNRASHKSAPGAAGACGALPELFTVSWCMIKKQEISDSKEIEIFWMKQVDLGLAMISCLLIPIKVHCGPSGTWKIAWVQISQPQAHAWPGFQLVLVANWMQNLHQKAATGQTPSEIFVYGARDDNHYTKLFVNISTHAGW